MTLNTDKTTKKDASDQDTNQDQANAGTNQDNNQGENQDKDSGKVPLNTFLDQKKINKELKDKLATYEAKDKAAADAKLLEEKKYEELIQTKSSETEALRKELEIHRLNSKVKTVKLILLYCLFLKNLIKFNNNLIIKISCLTIHMTLTI